MYCNRRMGGGWDGMGWKTYSHVFHFDAERGVEEMERGMEDVVNEEAEEKKEEVDKRLK